MNLRGLQSRLARIERLIERLPDRRSPRITLINFSLYAERLPEWFVTREGGRVVEDFFFTTPATNPENGTNKVGYIRERVTFDPDDRGRERSASKDPLWRARHAGDPVEPEPTISAPSAPGRAARPTAPTKARTSKSPAQLQPDIPDWFQAFADLRGKNPSELTVADLEDPGEERESEPE